MSTHTEVNEELEGHNPHRWCSNCGEWIEEPCIHEMAYDLVIEAANLPLDETEATSQWFDEKAIRDEREAMRAEEEREWYYAQQLQRETDDQ